MPSSETGTSCWSQTPQGRCCPPVLVRSSFSTGPGTLVVRDASPLHDAGMYDELTPLRGPRPGRGWVRVSHGLYRPAGLLEDLSAWQLVLPPTARFSHLTGAAVLGWWTPPLPDDLPVFVAMAESETRPQRAGLRITRHPDVPESVEVAGLRLDTPAEVLRACARDLGLLDLVVLVDAALHLGSCSWDDIAAAAALRRRGSPKLRKALALADPRSESAWETLLRVFHVSCDVPVEPQYRLEDDDGSFIARADLWVCGTNALHEYDGSHHLERQQQRKDLARARQIGNHTWIRRGYTSADLLHQAVTILRDADLSLGREHRPSRVRRWHKLLLESTVTPAGMQRLRTRLDLLSPETGGESALRGA